MMGFDHHQRKALRVGSIVILIVLVTLVVSACTQQNQPDPRLKLFHVLSSRLITLDTQAEVDGTLKNTGNIRYPFDISLVATFYDSQGHVIGQAGGVAEDVWPGMTRPFVLMGQVDSAKYSRMTIALISLRERRYEKNLPTPPPAQP